MSFDEGNGEILDRLLYLDEVVDQQKSCKVSCDICNRGKSKKRSYEHKSYSWLYELWAIAVLGRLVWCRPFYSKMHLEHLCNQALYGR